MKIHTTPRGDAAAYSALERAHELDPPQPGDDDTLAAFRIVEPVDWHELWADDTEDEWLLYPLLPERRHIAIYSEAKVGKSLLILEIAVAVSRGAPVLGSPTRQTRVLYVDFENDPRGDVRTRLEDMGYGPDDLGGLIYLSFPTMAALNTREGGEQLLRNAEHHGCGLVVVDTISRSIAGEENSNDTWLGLYAHSGLRLKQAGIGMVRLDHTGKDASKGQRGGSAKTGDVDAVWSLARLGDDTFKLECSHHRFALSSEDSILTLRRREDPLRHDLQTGRAAIADARTTALIGDMDRLEIPLDWGRDKVRRRLAEAGFKHGNEAVSKAIRERRNLSGTGQDRSGTKTCPETSGQVPDFTLRNLSGTGPGQVGTGCTGGPVPASRSMSGDRSDTGSQDGPPSLFPGSEICSECGNDFTEPGLITRCRDNHQRKESA